MSFDALAWAAKRKPGNLAAKMVLLALANFADEHGCAYPSTAALAEFGDMDHKTATTALDRLTALGLIEDSGHRAGRTRQIKVYRLLMGKAVNDAVPGQVAYTYCLSHPDTGEFYIGMRCCAGLPENDRYFGSGLWPKRMLAQGVMLSKEVLSVFDSPNECRAEERALIEESAGNPLCRNVEFNRPKKTGVKTGGLAKTPVFSGKDPQKRGTDTIMEPVGIEANASTPSAWAKPDGVDMQVWKDLMANRKRKKMTNSPTAWKRFCDDLARISETTGISPVELIEYATASGWAGIYDPTARSKPNGQQGSRNLSAATAAWGHPSTWRDDQPF